MTKVTTDVQKYWKQNRQFANKYNLTSMASMILSLSEFVGITMKMSKKNILGPEISLLNQEFNVTTFSHFINSLGMSLSFFLLISQIKRLSNHGHLIHSHTYLAWQPTALAPLTSPGYRSSTPGMLG